MDWLISANSNMYKHENSFIDNGYIDWRQGPYKYAIDDIVYIYCTKPIKKIRFKCKVVKNNLTRDEILNDYEYWIDKSEYEKSLNGSFFRLSLLEDNISENLSLDNLLSHGLKKAPQGAQRLNGEILEFINEQFFKESKEYFPDFLSTNNDLYEGASSKVWVNKFERSSIARSLCVKAKGCKCIVCDFDFQAIYGELGKGFIHIHHLIPLHEVNSEYKINFSKDLVPVCPNCHAMLHRKLKGKEVTVKELRMLMRKT